jgi:hypothetical protein
MEPIWIALIAGVQFLALAALQGFLAARKDRREAEFKRKEKAEDYARQDLVADRVAAAADQAASAARLLVKAQADTILRTDEVARLMALSNKSIGEQLTTIDEQGKKIHILVNSDMTAARTNERDSMRLLLAALRQLQEFGRQINPTDRRKDGGDSEAIVIAERRIKELDVILADRKAAQIAVEEEARHAAERNPSPTTHATFAEETKKTEQTRS